MISNLVIPLREDEMMILIDLPSGVFLFNGYGSHDPVMVDLPNFKVVFFVILTSNGW